MDDLEVKEKKLNEIRSQLKFELYDGEKIMTVIFNSMKQDIHHSFICKNTDKFTRLENLLYDIDKYRILNLFFNKIIFFNQANKRILKYNIIFYDQASLRGEKMGYNNIIHRITIKIILK